MSRYCPKCGAEFGTDDETCPRCNFDPSKTPTTKGDPVSSSDTTAAQTGSKSGVASLFWGITLAGAVVAGVVAVAGFTNAQSAPQEAAAAGMAVAIAVIPYIFARAVQQLSG